MNRIRQLFWVLFIAATSTMCLWIVVGPWRPQGKLVVGLVFVLFALGSFGAYWMLYQIIRYEKHRVKFIVLVFFPFSFVWYYFERYRNRVRPDKHRGTVGAES